MSDCCCVDINYCGRGPDDIICCCPPVPEPKKCITFCHPCPRDCCKCPDIWPTLMPRVKCCIKPIPIPDCPCPPVVPRCQDLRSCPSRCPDPLPPMTPPKKYPPILPCYKPCCPNPVKVQPKPPKVRCLKPVIPCCPPPCVPPPLVCQPPEPPYPPYCPIFPPCICPDRPLIVHDSVRRFNVTSDCKMATGYQDNPLVCYIPISAEEMGQINFKMGKCYNTC